MTVRLEGGCSIQLSYKCKEDADSANSVKSRRVTSNVYVYNITHPESFVKYFLEFFRTYLFELQIFF
jgi:hypothetical protein